MTHVTASFGELPQPDGSLCAVCKERLALIIAPTWWRVDQEAFVSGERTDDDEDVPDEVEVCDEVTAHYCLRCERIRSISFNGLEERSNG